MAAPSDGTPATAGTAHALDALHLPLPRAVVWLAAAASGLAVASVYYAQPLLDAIAHEFGLGAAAVGAVVTWTQVGYGVGLLLLVPLGDLFDRRRLIIGQTACSMLALGIVAAAPSAWVFLAGMTAVGALAVVTQLHVAHASALAHPAQRGRVVGTVTSGIITGILLARAVSGALSDVWGWRAVYVAAAVVNLAVVWALTSALPPQARRNDRIGYAALVGSVFKLWREERALRERGLLALLVFMAMTVLWTPMVLALRAPPHALTHTQVGLFGLAGVCGALGATRAGPWADRGWAQRTTGCALALMLASWAMSALLPHTLWGLIAGVLLIDCGLQAVHVSNQSLIYRVRPEAQSRLTAAYMVCYSIGCALGSIASTAVYDSAGWLGVCALGAGISAAALLWWVRTLDGRRTNKQPAIAGSATSSSWRRG
ncbi:MAG TPA: MFS transporter [Burkholderiaceae bacterium]|nr:MFS transporter [Burkholderiaceae bacterium]